MAMIIWIVCVSLPFTNSFLFDSSTPKPFLSSSGDNRYDSLLKLFMEEQNARVQLEGAVAAQSQELVQYRTALTELNSRLERIEGHGSTTSPSITGANAYRDLEQKYQTLSQQHLVLQQNYSSLYKEHSVLVKDVEKLKQVQAVGHLQAIVDLQNVTSQVQNDVKLLMSNSQARAQDLQALNQAIIKNEKNLENVKTTTAHNISDVKRDINSLNLKTQSASQDLVNLYKTMSATVRDLQALEENTSTDISQIELHVESEFQVLNESINSLRKDIISQLQPVGFTAFGTSYGMLISGTIIKFPSIASSFGLTGLISFQNTGAFRAEKEGVYLIITSIMVSASTDNTYFNIYKNNRRVHSNNDMYYAGESGLSQHSIVTSGTGSLVLQLSVGDTVDVRTANKMYVYRYASSLTVIKIN